MAAHDPRLSKLSYAGLVLYQRPNIALLDSVLNHIVGPK
jgi:hypothetical protein